MSPRGIFEFDSYRGVDEYNKYWAQGSGRRYALGALHNSYDKKTTTSEELAIRSVEAACSFDDASAIPVLFETIKMKK